jgi:hypothetical protein
VLSHEFPRRQEESMIRRRWTAAVLVLVSVLAGGAAALAEEPAAPIDPAVASLAAEKGLSVAEATRRIGWQQRSANLADTLEAAVNPDQLGGIWIGTDDRVTVGVVARPTPGNTLRSSIASMASSVGLESAGLNVVTVRYSLAKLIEANEWLANLFEVVNAGSTLMLTAGGYLTSANVVRLGLPPGPAALTPAQQAAVAEARQRYGDMLTTYTTGPATPAACSAEYCDTPLRGGVRFVGGLSCTLGFIGRSRANGRLYAITAGHCLRVPNGFVTTSQFAAATGAHTIGPARNSVYGLPGDAALIEITNLTTWKPQARLYVTDAPASGGVDGMVRNELYPIMRDGLNQEGLRVCKRGYAGGTRCGRVQALGVTVNYHNADGSITIVGGLAEANYCTMPGDSGGPVFAGNTAYGLVSGHVPNTCSSFYQVIRVAENLMNFNVSFV